MARNAFAAWLAWWDEARDELEVIATEIPIVHERFRFGGTFDALARNRAHGWLECLDWKTSSGIYLDYVYQMGGYSLLIEQRYGEAPRQSRIVQVNKHDAGRIEPCDDAWLATITVGSKLRSFESLERPRAEAWLEKQLRWARRPRVLCIGDEPDGKFAGHMTLAREQFVRLRKARFYEERIRASLALN